MGEKGDKIVFLHSQVLRIREEDLLIGEDMNERSVTTGRLKDEEIINYAKSGCVAGGFSQRIGYMASTVDVVWLTSRPLLPSSPLGGKTAVKASP